MEPMHLLEKDNIYNHILLGPLFKSTNPFLASKTSPRDNTKANPPITFVNSSFVQKPTTQFVNKNNKDIDGKNTINQDSPSKPVSPPKPTILDVKSPNIDKEEGDSQGEPAPPSFDEKNGTSQSDSLSKSEAQDEMSDSDGSALSDEDYIPSRKNFSWKSKKKLKSPKSLEVNSVSNSESNEINPILKENWTKLYKEIEPESQKWIYEQVVNFPIRDPDSAKPEIEQGFGELSVQDIYRCLGIKKPFGLPSKLGAFTRLQKNLCNIINKYSSTKESQVDRKRSSDSSIESEEAPAKKQIVNKEVKNEVNNEVINESEVKKSSSEIGQVFISQIKCMDPTKPKVFIISKVQLCESDIIGYFTM